MKTVGRSGSRASAGGGRGASEGGGGRGAGEGGGGRGARGDGPGPELVPAYPWPLPCAVALSLGIVGRGIGLPFVSLILLLPLLWPLRHLLLTPAVPAAKPVVPEGPEAQPPAASRPLGVASRSLVALLLPGLLVPIGYLRMQQWQAQPDPLTGLRDRELVLSGSSDGRILTLDEPAGVRVAVAPTGALAAGDVVLRGTLLEASGRRNPGGFDYRGYLLRRGVHGQVLVEEVLEEARRVRPIERLRAGVRQGLPSESAALLEAMTLGVRDELGDLREVFAEAGLAHVLALSGLHVGLLMAAAGWLLAPLGVSRYPLLLALDLGYMALVGASPSVVRAAIMVAVVLVSLWMGAGRIEPWPALGLAALITLLVRPAWLFDVSLQLSYGAVAGILLFALPLAGKLRGEPPLPWWHPRLTVVGAGLTSLAAQGLTLPLVASSFGSLPLLSPLVNVVALPLASLLVPLGFAAAVLGLVSLPLSGLVNTVTGPLAELLLRLAHAGAALPGLPWGEVEPVGFAYYFAAAGAVCLGVRGLLRPSRVLVVVAVAITASYVTPPRHPVPELIALDVGQGDSLLLRLPGRVEVLVDGGGTPFGEFDVGEGTVLPALRALGVDELELVVATHADLDHMEGLVSVLRGIPVQLLAIGFAEPGRPVFDDLVAAANDRGVPVRELRRGEQIVLGEARLEVLNPPPWSYGKSNDDSVAFAVHYGGVARALLLGDMSEVVERDLVVPKVDVLVAAHHGSGSSSSAELLAAAEPDLVIVSVGRNGYGHPSSHALERFSQVAAEVRLTRDEGAVRVPLAPSR